MVPFPPLGTSCGLGFLARTGFCVGGRGGTLLERGKLREPCSPTPMLPSRPTRNRPSLDNTLYDRVMPAMATTPPTRC